MNNQSLLKEIGERVYNRRKSLGYTQEQLAEKMNVSVQMISNLELGKKAIRPENIIKICSALEISADYLLMGCSRKNSIDHIIEKAMTLSQKSINVIAELIDILSESENT
ncbi:MAG: helix-turn-helix domain-containing protein [Acutalibacteraceae bacterium]